MIARVRLRQGVVGEAARVVHLAEVRLETLDEREPIVALCGTDIARDAYEVLPEFVGMPCVVCLGRSPDARPAELTASSFKISGP